MKGFELSISDGIKVGCFEKFRIGGTRKCKGMKEWLRYEEDKVLVLIGNLMFKPIEKTFSRSYCFSTRYMFVRIFHFVLFKEF